ncbi:hypothetical protein Tco_0174812 [Tanacetum coccineum]
MHVKHHEEQVESIVDYLEELSFHYIKKLEERMVNDWIIIPRDFDKVKTKLKEARTQIRELQKKHMGQRDKIAFAHFWISDLEMTLKDIQDCHMKNLMGYTSTSTSEAPTMTQAAIRKLVADSIATALEAQTAKMASTNGKMPPKRASTSATPIMTPAAIRKLVANIIAIILEEIANITHRLMDQVLKRGSIQGISDHKRKFDDRRTFNHNNDNHQQQNKRQENFRTNKKYHGNLPLCTRCTLHHIGPCTVRCQTCNKVGHQTRNYNLGLLD